MRGCRHSRRNAFEKSHNGRGLARERAKQGTPLGFHRLRADEASRGKMFHEAEEERQVAGADAFFVKRQDEESGGDMQQKIGIFDAFGNAFIGKQLAEVVIGEKAREGPCRKLRYRQP